MNATETADYINRTNQVLIAYEALGHIMAATFAATDATAADRAYEIARAALAAMGPYHRRDTQATPTPAQIEQRSNADDANFIKRFSVALSGADRERADNAAD